MPLQCTRLEVALPWRCLICYNEKKDHVRRLEPGWQPSGRTAAASNSFHLETIRLAGRQAGSSGSSTVATASGRWLMYVGATTFNGTFLAPTADCSNAGRQLLEDYKPEAVDCQASSEHQLLNGLGKEQGSAPPGDDFQSLCNDGLLDRALHVLLLMEHQGSVPSISMYRSLLKACTKRKALAQAKRVYAHLAKHRLETTTCLGEYVVSTLVQCGGLQHAVQVFQKLPHRTVVSWSALISGYTMCGQGQTALKMYKAMLEEDVKPNTYTFVSVLKACGRIADLEEGKRIHAQVVDHGCDSNLLVGTCLVDMYGKCGSIRDAQNVFDKLPRQDVVSWTTMLVAYTQHGQPEKALQLYEVMLESGISPNDRCFVSALQACVLLAEREESMSVDGRKTKVIHLKTGQALHSDAWRKGYDLDVFVCSTLVAMYGKCGIIENAQIVFDRLVQRDVVTWTAMIMAWIEQGQAVNALHLYILMQQEGVSPDARTLVAGLQACAMIAGNQGHVTTNSAADSLKMGMSIHAHAWSTGYGSDVFVGSALVTMYGKCASIPDMKNVFDGLTERNVVSWNALLVVYVEQCQADKAVQLYEQMLAEGISPNARTFVSVLQAFCIRGEKEREVMVGGTSAKVDSLEKGKVLHADALRNGCVSDVFVGNTLVHMYGKCGSMLDAQCVFDGLSHRHVVSWNVMIAAYVAKGQAETAFELYRQMKEEGVTPDEVTLMCILQASGNAGSLSTLKQIHHALVSTGHLQSAFVASTLITAYGRCASIIDAQTVFGALHQPDLISWNALIAAYARQGDFAATLQCYEDMRLADLKPNGVTFLSLLSGCSHAGLVDKGVEYFESMSRDYGIIPGIEHYSSMVDLFGRAGLFRRLKELLSRMPMQPDLAFWLGVLAMCRKHSEVVLGEQAFESAVLLEPKHSAAYLLMSNIYADAGLWHRAKEVRELEHKAVAWKKPPGQSWIKHENDVHTFLVGNGKYTEQEHLYNVVGKVSSEPEDVPARHQVQDDKKANDTSRVKFLGSKAQQNFQRTRSRELPGLNIPPSNCLLTLSAAENGLEKLPGSPFARPLESDLRSFCKQGQLDKAMKVLLQIENRGIIPSVSMYSCLLKACTKSKALAQAKQVHAHLAKHGLESTCLGEYVVTTLVKCGGLDDALQVFHRLPRRNVFTWTTIISGLTTFGNGHGALRMYELMREQGVQPDAYIFASLLKACGSIGDLQEGKRVHAEALKYNCTSDIFVNNCLVNMYGKCGSISDALNVFQQMFQRDVVTWNAMLTAYVQQGQAEKAVQLYQQMRKDGLHPNARTFVSSLQACGMLAEQEDAVMVDGRAIKTKALKKGQMIHADAQRGGYDSDAFVGSTLVSMYGKCGSITDAQIAFDRLSHPDVVTWNAIMAAYVEHGRAEKVLQLYEQLRGKAISPNDRTFVSALQACGLLAADDRDVTVDERFTKLYSLQKGQAIHADAQRRGYDSDVFVGSTLVSMYGKCGSIEDAQKVFDGLSKRNVVAWTAILGAYVEQGQAEKALQVYWEMQQEGISPDVRTFAPALQACSMLADLEGLTTQVKATKVRSLGIGMAIHADAQRKGDHSDAFVASSLICMYGKCGSIADAYNVFHGLSQRNVVSWNAMLAVYVEQGQVQKAVQLYDQMGEEGISPDAWTIVSTLQAWGMLADMEDVLVGGVPTKLKCLEKGREIHDYLRRKGYDVDVFVGNALVSMYGKCGSVSDAQRVFDGLPRRNVVSWNAMVSACILEGQADKALQVYRQMQQEGISPDVRTVLGALQACRVLGGQLGNVFSNDHLKLLELGKAIHADARSKGYDSDVFICSTLVSMYGKCGSIVDAQHTFDGLSRRDTVIWNAMLGAYVQNGQGEKALELYEKMLKYGVNPDDQTFVSALQACGVLAENDEFIEGEPNVLMKGRAIHADAQRNGYDSDIFVINTLVSMYSKCGSLVDAQKVFDELSHHDAVSWNALVTAYIENGQVEKALQLYRQMKADGVTLDDFALAFILRACGKTGSLGMLQEIHHSLLSAGSCLSSLTASTLISAYGRCASIVDAQSVFDAVSHPDEPCWNALIASYARQGNCAVSLQWYEEMQRAGVKPDGVTFLSLLSGCSQAGLVDKGVDYFASMSRDHGINPEMDHYLGMVDLFGRAGCFSALEDFLSTMPVQPNLSIWLCVLGACQKHCQVVLGEKAFEYAVHLQPKQSAAYVMMSNIYSDAGMWDSAKKVKDLRAERAAWKKPGQSWIEHKQEVQSFLVGDGKQLLHKDVYDFLRKANLEWKHLDHGPRSVPALVH